MRYRVAIAMLLMLLIVLPVMYLPAAPAPERAYAILDIGPPPEGMTAAEYCKDTINRLSHIDSGVLWVTGIQPEVGKLPSVARSKDVHPWLEKNIRVMRQNGERRLRLTFQAGGHAEQVVILTTLLRVYRHTPRLWVAGHIEIQEESLRLDEDCVAILEIFQSRARRGEPQRPDRVEGDRQAINNLRNNRIPAGRAEIARLKQITVVKWAK